VLRKGLFWYYLEGSPLRPAAHAETEPPCAPVYDPVRKDLLFSVSFYRRRINLEVYHALTDGTGALQFLRLLVYHYLVLRHADALGEGVRRSITTRRSGSAATTASADTTAAPRQNANARRARCGCAGRGSPTTVPA
jgi:hypothetical protein